MAEIGLRSGKVRAGFYRCGEYCIHKGSAWWAVYVGARPVKYFKTLTDAYSWCRQHPIERSHA